jgi:aryl-alcohol dehydrogenase-like predicted oxidoreductase
MNYVNLGRSGLKVSRLALGMMTWGSAAWRPWIRSEAEAAPIVRRALDLGINVFDTADMYSAGLSEELTGRLLAQAPRDEIVVATKLFMPVDLAFKGQNAGGAKPAERPNGLRGKGLSRKRIMTAVDASLRRLNLDYIDLYQMWSRPARCATSAPVPCGPGSSRRCSLPPSATASRALSRCRTTTTSPTARKSAR